MGNAPGLLSHLVDADDRTGDRAAGLSAIAELAEIVGAPGGEFAAGQHGEGVVAAGRDGLHGRQGGDTLRRRPLSCRAVAQLAADILAPGGRLGPHNSEGNCRLAAND